MPAELGLLLAPADCGSDFCHVLYPLRPFDLALPPLLFITPSRFSPVFATLRLIYRWFFTIQKCMRILSHSWAPRTRRSLLWSTIYVSNLLHLFPLTFCFSTIKHLHLCRMVGEWDVFFFLQFNLTLYAPCESLLLRWISLRRLRSVEFVWL